MRSAFRSAHLGIAGGVLAVWCWGCGSSAPAENYPDAHVPDGGTPDVFVQPDVGSGGGDAGSDTGGDSGGVPGKPDPVSGDGNVKLFSGTGPIQFLRNGPPCTAEAGSPADRWCAFVTTSATNAANMDLFVVNVSQAATGTPVTCGGVMPDPNCLRLTRGFFEESEAPIPHAAFFQGDTLVYFDVTGAPYGWRPGMSNGRLLSPSSGGDVHDCFPAPKGTAIMCLRDLPESTASLVVSSVLLGRLDAIADPPLERVDTVISRNAADPTSGQRFQYGWVTPAGDLLAWSSRQDPSGPEILRTRKVDDALSLRTVASDVSRWSASADGTRWYWLSQFGTTAGNLQTAALPDGSGATTMVPDVHDYVPAAGGAVVALTSTQDLKSVPSPATAPTTVIDLDTKVGSILKVGPQHVVYIRKLDFLLPLSDGYVRRLDGTTDACILSFQTDAVVFGMQFLPDSSGLLWARLSNPNFFVGDVPPLDAIITDLSSCSKSTVASKVGLSSGDWALAGDQGIAYIEQADFEDGTLRTRRLAAGPKLDTAAATLINTRVSAFLPIFPMPGAVLFTVNAGSTKDGLYLNVPKSRQAK